MGLDAMTALDLPYVVSDTDRHGNRRFYFRRRPEPKVRLPGRPGSPEFMEAYKAAEARKPVAPDVRLHEIKGSFAWACHAYYQDKATFKKLDLSTRNWQRRALDAIATEHGAKALKTMKPRHVRNFRDAKIDTPAAANTMLKALRALFQWALEQNLADADPTQGVRRVRYVSKGHHSWSLAEVEQYEERWPVGTKQRLALALMLYTAGRREDATRLGPQHIDGKRLRFTQAKNEDRNPIEVNIPMHAELADILARTPIGATAFLVTEYGKPFSAAGFGNRFREWCDAAGLPQCSAHGLRKATAARLAERGATPHEIMAITGHQTIEEVQRYTAAARRAGLADKAMARLKKAKAPPKTVGPERQKV